MHEFKRAVRARRAPPAADIERAADTAACAQMADSRRTADNVAYELNQEHRPSLEFCGTKWGNLKRAQEFRKTNIE